MKPKDFVVKSVLKIMKLSFLCVMGTCLVTSANLVAMAKVCLPQVEQFVDMADNDPVILTGAGFDEACGCHVDAYIAAIDMAEKLRIKIAKNLDQLDVEIKNLTFGQAILIPTISGLIRQAVDVVCYRICTKQPERMKEYVLKMRVKDGLAKLQELVYRK